MSESRLNLILSSVATAVSVVCAALLALSTPAMEASLLSTGVLVAAVGISGVALLWTIGRHREQQRAARRYLELLADVDEHTLASEALDDPLPVLQPNDYWYDPLNRIRQRLAQQCSELVETEHSLATLEVRVQRSQSQLDRVLTILNSLHEPIVVIDSYDELLLANPSARRLLGLSSRDVDRRGISKQLPGERLAHLLHEVRRRRVPTSRIEDVELIGADGEQRAYRVTATNLIEQPVDAQGQATEPPGALLVLRDVSTEKATQRKNAEFVSAVSHEMKTPLAGIKAYVELLADGDAEDDATREEFLEVINGQTDRLRRLIENLLDLSRIEAGVVKVSKESQSVNDICAEALSVVQPSAEAKQIELAHYLSPLYLGALADRDMLLQAIINLLSNAIKYTPEGGKVTLRSRLVDEQIEIGVQDTGVGLAPEDCRRVFEKFYRVQKDKNMAPGTGLGLPLVKHIVEDVHGGRMALESEPGRGSTFTIIIPRCVSTANGAATPSPTKLTAK